MDPQRYVELDTDLMLAKYEEYLAREYCRRWLARSEATQYEGHGSIPDGTPKQPWEGQPVAYDWIVVQGKPYYPHPPDTSPNNPPLPSEFTYRAAVVKRKAGEGGVIVLSDDILAFATGQQTLSDGSTFDPVDFEAEGKTVDQLTTEGQAAVAPPPLPPPGEL